MSGNEQALRRRNRAQFGEMLRWRARGWRPRPGGHRCRDCGGPMWGKVFGRWERFMCVSCGNTFEVKTG